VPWLPLFYDPGGSRHRRPLTGSPPSRARAIRGLDPCSRGPRCARLRPAPRYRGSSGGLFDVAPHLHALEPFRGLGPGSGRSPRCQSITGRRCRRVCRRPGGRQPPHLYALGIQGLDPAAGLRPLTAGAGGTGGSSGGLLGSPPRGFPTAASQPSLRRAALSPRTARPGIPPRSAGCWARRTDRGSGTQGSRQTPRRRGEIRVGAAGAL
jgi:hypothetical protein